MAMPLRPERIMLELSHAMPEGTLVVADTGHSAAWCCLSPLTATSCSRGF